ncbi:hypothetical protein DYB25_000105 [Aphanomyces astaci]|uniref:Uncharacterized protein n=4 Tax=Aphanomyces astaci TaxID=112090 RepID=A0A397FFW9_APHAT|nr:hypothetical protein DYB36_008564 [Aphanomyces astaci]RHY06680.1 hypothetical protein DYB25_000105 [Aphanomyces astaci]RHY35897.1 hypothetical protein DYB34_003315 [Aphanomyces astaci]RHY57117.1 hypothetical protein DYB38_002455 [Aphanomyces astaci]RHY85448.1 hypothetical protein DYB26_002218 [Aphanomyces astaci]
MSKSTNQTSEPSNRTVEASGTMFPTAEVGQDFLEFFIHFDESSERDASSYEASMQEELDVFLQGYVWQKEPLVLGVSTTLPRALHGKMLVGDNVEDEWVATAALNTLTKKHSNITVQVWDADGEFLLIEAAEALPAWLNPDNSANRVFLRRGHLHIVHQNPTERHMELHTALSFVTDPETPSTRANKVMDAIVLDRLGHATSYSMQPDINHHHVQCMLPPAAALVFQALPHSIAYAVEAFYYRDPTEATQVCRHMQRFPVPSTSTGMATAMVPLTRCMYAQVKQQQFAPPKPFQPTTPRPDADANVVAAAELGMKLCCGLELLCHSRVQDWRGTVWRDAIDALLQDPARKFVPPSDLRPSDDDSWMYVTPEGLEAMLDAADSKLQHQSANDDEDGGESGGQALQTMASLFDKFVHTKSDYEGVATETLPTEVSFNMHALMEILKSGNVGDNLHESPRSEQDTNVDDYFFESEDDEVDMDAMMAEMDSELTESKMAKSFLSQPHQPGPPIEHDGDNVKPVDVDFNLVSNLLASVASQDGGAGPVSNMLRDMGFQIK